jgi:acetylglutamate kinase
MGDIVLLSLIGVKVVLVHGGGPEDNRNAQKDWQTNPFIDGCALRRRNADRGADGARRQINKSLFNLLQNIGGKAIGLCGMAATLLRRGRCLRSFAMSGK